MFMELYVIAYRSATTGRITGEVLEDSVQAKKIAEQYTKIAEGGCVQVMQISPPFPFD